MNTAALSRATPAIGLTHWPGQAPNRPPLVLFHGWGQSGRAWAPIREAWGTHFDLWVVDLPGHGDSDAIAWSALDDWLDALMARLPAPAVVAGWSLGGQVATRLAARYPDRVTALLTLASNPRFVADTDWPGMSTEVFETFRSTVARQGAEALSRFEQLMLKGAAEARQLRRQYRALALPAPTPGALIPALEALATLDTRALLPALPMPVAHVLGEGDALVPSALGERLETLCPEQRVYVTPASGHVPFLAEPERVLAILRDLSGAPDKQAVARAFDRAVPTYDTAATLQRTVADALLTHLRPRSVGTVLDLGCGTGTVTGRLRQHCPDARVLGLDLSSGMARHARRHHDVPVAVADAERLPLPDAGVELVFSNLMVQWCDLSAVLREARRVLKPGGCLVFSTFGPASLRELHRAWARVDARPRVNRFLSRDAIARLCEGWHVRVLTSERHDRDYPTVSALLRELKQLGATYRAPGRSTGLTGRRAWAALEAAYPTRNGVRPATWEVIEAVLERPA